MSTVKILFLAISLLFGTMATSPTGTTQKPEKKGGLTWYTLKKAQQLAKKNNKKVLIFAEASWCPYCKKMKREVFPKTDIQNTMEKFYYPVKIDIESEKTVAYKGKKMTKKQFSREMRVSATPTFIFMRPSGSVIGTQPGFIEQHVYKALLTYIGTDSFKDVGFKKYMKRIKTEH